MGSTERLGGCQPSPARRTQILTILWRGRCCSCCSKIILTAFPDRGVFSITFAVALAVFPFISLVWTPYRRVTSRVTLVHPVCQHDVIETELFCEAEGSLVGRVDGLDGDFFVGAPGVLVVVHDAVEVVGHVVEVDLVRRVFVEPDRIGRFNVLVDDPDVAITVWSAVFMEEPNGVADLMQHH